MKKIFYIGLLCLTLSACFKEEMPNLQGTPASLTLTFNVPQNNIETRAVSPDLAEKRIFNLYIFVFNKDGLVDYQVFNTFPSVIESRTLTLEGMTCGTGKSVAVIANMHESNTIANLTKETLDAIKSRAELEELVTGLHRGTIDRGPNFLMSGIVEGLEVTDNGTTPVNVPLTRVDAKIRFNVTVAADTGNKLAFTPSDWRVVSAPYKIRVMSSSKETPIVDKYFNTDWAKFEDGEATFAFYSMEHLPPAKEQITDDKYASREKQEKTPIEGDLVKNGAFVYAPETGTYVEMRGKVTYNEDGKEISADVVYTVHLGGLDGVNDYNTRRNTFYTYNVKIVSVNQIKVEVDDNIEQRPGAVGDITVSPNIINLDASNEIFTLNLKETDIDDNLTWHVSTPFSKSSNGPQSDYKWIYFRINSKSSGIYTSDFRTYTGDDKVYENITLSAYMSDITNGSDKMLDVKQLVTLLKESKKEKTAGRQNLFDNNSDIKFTAFVNEYYYYTDPVINTTVNLDLWKKFTNKQQRVMNILSYLKYSNDQESSKITAVYSIHQHSIQTMYNRSLDESFTAWGIETLQDETPVKFDTNGNSYVGDNVAEDPSNGRKNTIAMWKNLSWDTYITPGKWTMLSNYNSAKYKCLLMNRDNNGNGTIDDEEVQWYLAAINQLTDIWIGEGSYDPAARLYKDKTGTTQRFFVSSTVLNASGGKDNPQILWSSEGSSIGALYGATGGINTDVYYRCVRNLGMARDAEIDKQPDDLATYNEDTKYMSLKRLDAQSIRSYPQANELAVHHERDAANKPYFGFYVQDGVTGNNTSYTWATLYDSIQNGVRPCPAGYRVPNQRELSLMLSRVNGGWTLSHHFSRTRFQFGKDSRNEARDDIGFVISENGVNLSLTHYDRPFLGTASHREKGGIRCVKDSDEPKQP